MTDLLDDRAERIRLVADAAFHKMSSKINILLVDDQPAKLLSYEVVLAELGENLLRATSAREAFDHLLRTEVAILLVDVCMPELDGFELVRMIRSHPRFEKTAVIFVSAVQITDDDRLRGYAAGAVDYVPVPVIPEVLRAKVRIFAELYRKSQELAKLNTELEKRVAERTEALERSASELKRVNELLEVRVAERTRERELALAQLFEAKKMETIGQLTGGVAHDFNNLLMVILSSLALLKKRLPDDRNALRLLDNAVQGAQRGAALTQRLLAFARRQELAPKPVGLDLLLNGMLELVERTIGPGVRVSLEVPELLPAVRVDANQLELALLNIAVNARDAMPMNGSLRISARHETLAAEEDADGLPPGGYVCVAVSDTGTGMDPATLAKATEPFFTTKGPGKGTGLGLSMVQGLAQQSGGRMRLTSELGGGTTVEIWLPTTTIGESELAPPVREVVAQDRSPRALSILLVDDDPLVSHGTSAMLEDLGHQVIEAASGREALELLSSNESIDVVITDYAMPGMNGIELATRLRQAFPSLPIILASGYTELSAARPVAFDLPRLPKPYSQADVATLLGRIVSSPKRNVIAT